jgi:hypothetical protein
MVQPASWAVAAAVGLLPLAAGCANYRADIARRATFDLGCSVNETDVTDLGGYQFGVVACGCRATYVASTTWVLNNVSGESCSARTSGGESR